MKKAVEKRTTLIYRCKIQLNKSSSKWSSTLQFKEYIRCCSQWWIWWAGCKLQSEACSHSQMIFCSSSVDLGSCLRAVSIRKPSIYSLHTVTVWLPIGFWFIKKTRMCILIFICDSYLYFIRCYCQNVIIILGTNT